MISLIMNYQNLKNHQTANLAVFRRFWVVFGLFFGSFGAYVAVFLILVISTNLTL